MATIQKRARKKGVVWRAQVRIKGRAETATFDSKAQAHLWAEDIERRLRAGLPLPGELPDNDRELSTAVREYLEHLEHGKLKPATRRMYNQCAARVLAAFPGRSLKSITRRDMAAYRDDRLTRVGPAGIRHDFVFMRRLYAFARLNFGCDAVCPVEDLAAPAPPKNREPLLTREQIDALLAACRASKSPALYCYVLTLLHTAMRPSEAATLTWNQVRMRDNLILLTETKSGRTRAVPMVRKVRAVMRLLARKNPGEYVFLPAGTRLQRIPSDHFRLTFARICRRLGLHGITLYSLRHLAASHLIMAGADIRTVAEIMGHSDISMTMRYTHLANAHKLQALDRLQFK